MKDNNIKGLKSKPNAFSSLVGTLLEAYKPKIGFINCSNNVWLRYHSSFKWYQSDTCLYQQKEMGQEEGKLASNNDANCLVTQAQNEPPIAELLARNEKLVSKDRRFECDAEPFNVFYQKWDGTQNHMHEKPMDRFIELITQRYKEKKAPLSIVDVGCGYGKQAYNMKKRLQANGVEIEKFYGYDISADLIQISKEKYGAEPKMGYFKKNLDTQFKDVEEFDAVVSFCAIHWVNDIKATAEAISRSLRPKGLLLALIGIQCEDYHQLRVKFINTSKWAQCFKDNERKVSHFYFDKQICIETFQKYLTTINTQYIITPYKLSHDEAIDFMGNWIQEVRHIITQIKDEPRREAIIRAYTSDLIHSFPLGMTKNVIKNGDGSVIYKQHLLQYEGVKN